MVSAFASQAGLCLGQVATEQKSNEITAIPQLLDLIASKGCTITIDAMAAQEMFSKVAAFSVPDARPSQGAGHGPCKLIRYIQSLRLEVNLEMWQGNQYFAKNRARYRR